METRKAVLKGFDAGAYLATVQISGSLSVWLQGVPVARNIPTAEMITAKAINIPVALIRGMPYQASEGSTAPLLRDRTRDMFR